MHVKEKSGVEILGLMWLRACLWGMQKTPLTRFPRLLEFSYSFFHGGEEKGKRENSRGLMGLVCPRM